MDQKEIMELFNKNSRIGSLSTANCEGDVNAAVFGTPQMIDENTVTMGIGRNRSLKYLQENPKAVFIVVEPAETSLEWKGFRLYLEAVTIETRGNFYDQIIETITQKKGKEAAKIIHAAVRFRIINIRPLIDPL